MEREPEEPVGEGVGLITCWGLGVPGGPEPMPLCAPPLELSLLFCPISSRAHYYYNPVRGEESEFINAKLLEQ